jgi:predicted glycosyltransferase
MRVLFDLAHPAHVHLYRNLIKRVQDEGGSVLVVTRDKDVTVELGRAYGIPQTVLSRSVPGDKLAASFELIARTWKIAGLARRFRPDALVGSSVSIGPVGRMIRRPSFVFTEDDASVVPLFARVTYPFCTWLITPDSLAYEAHGPKHLTYPGYHELAYLHPAHFTPDPEVPRALGLDPSRPYFLVRLVALKGHHDAGASGMPLEAARKVVEQLSAHGRVLITSEGALLPELQPLRFPLPPEKLHDVLAFASAYVGDSQTMAIEAGVLGVPGLRCNSFVGRLSVIEELEHRDGLTRGFRPADAGALLAELERWCGDLPAARSTMQKRRDAMLARCVDLARWQWDLLKAKVTALPSPSEGGRGMG